jgi:hypothetical protein
MKQGLQLRTDQRLALFGRLKMAQWIEMPEKEFTAVVDSLERDPLFKKLFDGTSALPAAIGRQRWPRSRFHNRFYEVNEGLVAGAQTAEVETLVSDRSDAVADIRKIGREAFERFFLYGEEGLKPEEIARRTKLPLERVRALQGFLLEFGAKSEFFSPEPQLGRGYACVAELRLEDGQARFEFFSPHWARGRYHVKYDVVERWKREGTLAGEERRRLPTLLRRLETVNLRQNTMFRVLETLADLQTEYLRSAKLNEKRPVSLRLLARRLDLAPSTVSRAASGRSVRLPWGKEAPLIELMPGRRRVLREIVQRWLAEPGPRPSDAEYAVRLRSEHQIRVSRRTVNAVRNDLQKGR